MTTKDEIINIIVAPTDLGYYLRCKYGGYGGAAQIVDRVSLNDLISDINANSALGLKINAESISTFKISTGVVFNSLDLSQPQTIQIDTTPSTIPQLQTAQQKTVLTSQLKTSSGLGYLPLLIIGALILLPKK